MGDFITLERRTEALVNDDNNFDELFDILAKYDFPKELNHWIVRHYSKLDAIDQHTEDLTPDLARALLTDRKLLFPQTRERSFPVKHSRRLLDSTRYGKQPAETGLRLNKKNVEDLVASAHKYCIYALDLVAPERDFTENINKVDKMLLEVLEKCHSLNYIALELYPPNEDLDYVKHYSVEEQTAWVYTVQLRFPGRKKTVAAAKWFRKHNIEPVSDEEMFILLAYALPEIVSEAKRIDYLNRFYEAAGRKPKPVIAHHQLEELNKQIDAFLQRDSCHDVLSPWKDAGNLLNSYVSFDIDKYSNISKDGNNNLNGLDDCYELFSESFERYFSTIFPGKNKYTSEEDEQEPEEKMSDMLADFFLYRVSSDRKPLLINQPLTIYRIAHSPAHRNICSEKNSVNKISQMIQSCNSDKSFPIFKKFLNAEADLYRNIIDACALCCGHLHIDFDRKRWENLWECIKQSVNFLSYEYGDLLSPPVLFKSAYHDFHHFFPILDQWLRDRLSDTDDPFEPALWLRIYKSFENTSDQDDFEKEYLIPYRRMFTSTTPDLEELVSKLNSLATRISWNNITRLPTVEELGRADEKIPFKHKKTSSEQLEKYVEIVRYAFSEEKPIGGYFDRNDIKEIQLVMTEWILLQQICYQTQFNLFRAIDKTINGGHECTGQ